jgi:hypothetical protein
LERTGARPVRFGRTAVGAGPLNRRSLGCSLTSCRDLSGESPDDRRFPVHRSSLTPSLVPRGTRPKAGVTKSSEGEGRHESSDRRSQSGGRGKAAGRSIKRTMQRRNYCNPPGIAGRGGCRGWRLGSNARKPETAGSKRNGTGWRTHRRRVDGTQRKRGSESREGLVGRLGAPAQRRRGV